MECHSCKKQDLNFYNTLCVDCFKKLKDKQDKDFKYIKDAWSNPYHCLNAILSHLKICDKAFYDEVEPKKDDEHFFNELADLYILLSVYFSKNDYQKILKNRKAKFIQKIEEDEKNG
jgi:hypothetical protein